MSVSTSAARDGAGPRDGRHVCPAAHSLGLVGCTVNRTYYIALVVVVGLLMMLSCSDSDDYVSDAALVPQELAGVWEGTWTYESGASYGWMSSQLPARLVLTADRRVLHGELTMPIDGWPMSTFEVRSEVEPYDEESSFVRWEAQTATRESNALGAVDFDYVVDLECEYGFATRVIEGTCWYGIFMWPPPGQGGVTGWSYNRIGRILLFRV